MKIKQFHSMSLTDWPTHLCSTIVVIATSHFMTTTTITWHPLPPPMVITIVTISTIMSTEEFPPTPSPLRNHHPPYRHHCDLILISILLQHCHLCAIILSLVFFNQTYVDYSSKKKKIRLTLTLLFKLLNRRVSTISFQVKLLPIKICSSKT